MVTAQRRCLVSPRILLKNLRFVRIIGRLNFKGLGTDRFRGGRGWHQGQSQRPRNQRWRARCHLRWGNRGFRNNLTFFKSLFSSVNPKSLFNKEPTTGSCDVWKHKIPIEIGTQLIFAHFRAMITQFGLKISALGISKVPRNGHWYCEWLLVKSVYLVRKEHEE